MSILPFPGANTVLLPTQVKVQWYVITGLCVIWRIFSYIFEMPLWQNPMTACRSYFQRYKIWNFFPADWRISELLRILLQLTMLNVVLPSFNQSSWEQGWWMVHGCVIFVPGLESSKSSNNAREWSHGPNFKASIWKSLTIEPTKDPQWTNKKWGWKGLVDLIWSDLIDLPILGSMFTSVELYLLISKHFWLDQWSQVSQDATPSAAKDAIREMPSDHWSCSSSGCSCGKSMWKICQRKVSEQVVGWK